MKRNPFILVFLMALISISATNGKAEPNLSNQKNQVTKQVKLFSDYDDGYANGFALARNMMFDLVTLHPEWAISTEVHYNRIDPFAPFGVTEISYTTYQNTSHEFTFMSFGYSEDIMAAGYLASVAMDQNGSTTWLQNRQTLSDYDLGMWQGYCAGRASWFLSM